MYDNEEEESEQQKVDFRIVKLIKGTWERESDGEVTIDVNKDTAVLTRSKDPSKPIKYNEIIRCDESEIQFFRTTCNRFEMLQVKIIGHGAAIGRLKSRPADDTTATLEQDDFFVVKEMVFDTNYEPDFAEDYDEEYDEAVSRMADEYLQNMMNEASDDKKKKKKK